MAPVSPFYSTAPSPSPRSPLATVFPIFAALACIVCIPALFIHVRGRNFPSSVLMISFLVPNIFNFINPFIWWTESPQDWWNGAVLCDIEVKLQLALAAANVGAVACIFRQLALILDTDRTTLTPSSNQRIRKRAFEIGFCVGIPVYLMIVHYFVQPNRYYIYSVEGCVPSFDNSWVTIVLMFVWPLILSVVATVYGSLAVYRLIKYRRQFAVILAASTSSMTKSRFIRLFALSTSLVFIYLPLAIFTFQKNTSYSRHPYSWKRVHPPTWSQNIRTVAGQADGAFDRWTQIGTTFLIFPFFGLGQDAKALYRSWLQRLGLNRFTQPRTRPSRQTSLVYKREASAPEEGDQRKFDSHQRPISKIPITLHENEPLEKISSHKMPSYADASVHSTRRILSASYQSPQKPFQEAHITSRTRKAPISKIWSNEEPDSPVTSTQAIKVKDGFELTEHTVHLQV